VTRKTYSLSALNWNDGVTSGLAYSQGLTCTGLALPEVMVHYQNIGPFMPSPVIAGLPTRQGCEKDRLVAVRHLMAAMAD